MDHILLFYKTLVIKKIIIKHHCFKKKQKTKNIRKTLLKDDSLKKVKISFKSLIIMVFFKRISHKLPLKQS